jgi:hypothetical protein
MPYVSIKFFIYLFLNATQLIDLTIKIFQMRVIPLLTEIDPKKIRPLDGS